ncbi:hypothetical protein ES702_02870 [subsurface metagenome]
MVGQAGAKLAGLPTGRRQLGPVPITLTLLETSSKECRAKLSHERDEFLGHRSDEEVDLIELEISMATPRAEPRLIANTRLAAARAVLVRFPL